MFTADDLMELVDFEERADGKWRATLEVRGQGRIIVIRDTINCASADMRPLCTALADQLSQHLKNSDLEERLRQLLDQRSAEFNDLAQLAHA